MAIYVLHSYSTSKSTPAMSKYGQHDTYKQTSGTSNSIFIVVEKVLGLQASYRGSNIYCQLARFSLLMWQINSWQFSFHRDLAILCTPVCTSRLDNSITAEEILLESSPLHLEVIWRMRGRTSLWSSPNRHAYEVTNEISTINMHLILKTCIDNFLAKLNFAELAIRKIRNLLWKEILANRTI